MLLVCCSCSNVLLLAHHIATLHSSLCVLGDIAYPEGANATAALKKSKRRLRDSRDNFDVRDTFSEPRVGRGLG